MMKSLLIVTAVAFLSLPLVTEADDAQAEAEKLRKERLQKILSSLKTKAAVGKPRVHEISVPVASAGARGAAQKAGNRFAVIWPEGKVSPLSALSKNIHSAAGQGKSWSTMKLQLLDFVDNFPEYKDEPLLKELNELLDGATEKKEAK